MTWTPSVPSGAAPMWVMRSPSTTTSAATPGAPVPSSTVPPRMTSVAGTALRGERPVHGVAVPEAGAPVFVAEVASGGRAVVAAGPEMFGEGEGGQERRPE